MALLSPSVRGQPYQSQSGALFCCILSSIFASGIIEYHARSNDGSCDVHKLSLPSGSCHCWQCCGESPESNTVCAKAFDSPCRYCSNRLQLKISSKQQIAHVVQSIIRGMPFKNPTATPADTGKAALLFTIVSGQVRLTRTLY